MLNLLIMNLIVTLGLSLSACSRYSSSGTSNENSLSSVTLTGKAVSESGQAIENADIFAGNLNKKLGQTSSDGSFRINVSGDHKKNLKNQMPNLSEFNLYLQQGSGENALGGLSAPVSINSSGEKDLGSIVISQAATISGIVWSQRSEGQTAPEAGVTVRVGPLTAFTDSAGKFTLRGVPAGTVGMMMQLGGFASQTVPVSVQAGQTKFLEQPVIMYPEDAVAGDIVPLSVAEVSASYDSRLPYLHSFHVYSSSNSAKIRFSHIKAELESDSLPWQPARDIMQYNFPDAGAQMLFVQFASEDLRLRSEISRFQMNLDPFALSAGLLIENGAPRIFNRTARISIDVPPTATRMRLAQDPIALQSSPWEMAQAETLFNFTSILDRSTNTINANGIHELYLQFSDPAGFESKVYRTSTYIEIFPIEWREQVFVGPNVFVMDDGSVVSNRFLVSIDLVPPPNAVEVAIFEGIIVAGGVINPVRDTRNYWLDVNQPLVHTFDYDGAKVVYVQFRDRDHALSPVYSNFITIDPTFGYQNDEVYGYNIANNGAFCEAQENTNLPQEVACLNTRWVSLELRPPETASKFTISEGNPSNNVTSESAWRTIPYDANGRPRIPYEITGIGRRQINVHYQNYDGRTLPAYSKEVEVRLNSESSFDFEEINNEIAARFLVVDPDCDSIDCIKAETNTTNIWLAFNAPRFAALRRVFVTSNGMTSVKETSANETSVTIAPETTSQVYVEYLAADGVTISQTEPRNVLHRSDFIPAEPPSQP